MSDTKFDSKAIATAYVGHGYLEGRKFVKEYTVDFKNKGKIGSVLFSTSYWANPTFFLLEKQEKKGLLFSQLENICLERKNFNKKYHCLHHMRIPVDKCISDRKSNDS